jgi:hypothetical protein
MLMNCGSPDTVDDQEMVQKQQAVVETTSPNSTANSNNKENTLVAVSDHQAAINGLDMKMNAFQEKATNDEEKELLEHAHDSLKKHLNHVVQPIDDALFNEKTTTDFVQEIEVQYDDDIDDSDDDDDDQDDADEPIDDDELIDAEAKERARQLRDEVRSASMNLTQYKDSITKKADELWMKEDYSAAEMQTAMMALGHKNIADMKYAFRGKTKDATSKSVAVLEMVANLQKLTKRLTQMDLDKPMDALEETVDTVEQGIADATAEPEQMSQTEKAIKSRTNEGGAAAEEENPFSYENALPEDRLAAFLAQHVE